METDISLPLFFIFTLNTHRHREREREDLLDAIWSSWRELGSGLLFVYWPHFQIFFSPIREANEMFSLASFDLVPWDLFIYLLIGSFFTMEGNESIPSVWRLKAGLIGLCRPWMNFLNFYFMAGTGGIRFFSQRNLKLNRRGRKKRRWKRSHKLRTNWKRLLFNCPMERSRFVRFSYSRLKKQKKETKKQKKPFQQIELCLFGAPIDRIRVVGIELVRLISIMKTDTTAPTLFKYSGINWTR